jgi:hypothetical protein
MDNVLAKNENANTARRKRALEKANQKVWAPSEDPVHSDYVTCLK